MFYIQEELSQLRRLLIPINTAKHWILVVCIELYIVLIIYNANFCYYRK